MSENSTLKRALIRKIDELEATNKILLTQATNAAQAASEYEKRANELAYSSRAYVAAFIERNGGTEVVFARAEIEAAFEKAKLVQNEVSEDGETVRYFYGPEIVAAEPTPGSTLSADTTRTLAQAQEETKEAFASGEAEAAIKADAREPETPPSPAVEELSELDEPEPAELPAVAEGF